jgi:hypothetical protein
MTSVQSFTIGVDLQNQDARLAAQILSEELEKRVGAPFPLVSLGEGAITVEIDHALPKHAYALHCENGKARIRGFHRLAAIHGAGRLLKEAFWQKGGLCLPELSVETAPVKEFRGSQIGYRAKTNAYDAWDKPTYAQYIRDQALFGASAIEFLPPNTDDAPENEIMKYPIKEMLAHTVSVAHELGLAVWLWYPNLYENHSGQPLPASGFLPETDEKAKELNEILRIEDAQRHAVLSSLVCVDHIMIPGGDPGKLEAEDLFAACERMANILHTHHPHAKVWVSPQVMRHGQDFTEAFYRQVAKKPAWLAGICHAPWCNHTMSACREKTPAELPIRSYPDICHMLCCQFPVHRMDPIWAITAGRECYNPRPRWHKRMHNVTAQYHVGCVAYSEGIADDVAKFIWIDQDWDPSTPVIKTLRDFASMFISPKHRDELATLLSLFEDVYEGPVVTNQVVSSLYESLISLQKKLESEAFMPGFGADSYRFGMPLLMSAFYVYIQRRAIRDKAVWEKMWAEFDENRPASESIAAMRKALSDVFTSPDPALSDDIWALANELYDKIGWQTSEKLYASGYDRGGFLDTMEIPLCNARWLLSKLADVEKLENTEAVSTLKAYKNRTNPGPGGKYISLGSPDAERYVPTLADDLWNEPEAVTIPRIEHHVGYFAPEVSRRFNPENDSSALLERVASLLAYYDAKVQIDVDMLAPGKAYELRVVFPLRFGWKGIENPPTYLKGNGQKLNPLGFMEEDPWVYRYEVPAGLIKDDGILTLEVVKEPFPRGSGLTELWLIPKY